MTHYQRKAPKLLDYAFYSYGPLLFTVVLVLIIFNVGFAVMNTGLRILGAAMFALAAFYSWKQLLEFLYEMKHRNLIQLDKDKITYISSDTKISIKWIDIASVQVVTSRYFNASDKIVFFARNTNPMVWTSRITEKRIWANLADEMLEDIKKLLGNC